MLELAESAVFYCRDGVQPLTEKAEKLLDAEARERLGQLASRLDSLDAWDEDTLQETAKALAEDAGVKLVKVAQPLRAAVTGSNMSPSMFEVMRILGREETMLRLKAYTS